MGDGIVRAWDNARGAAGRDRLGAGAARAHDRVEGDASGVSGAVAEGDAGSASGLAAGAASTTKAKPADPFIRAENEDDDGYDPYSDRRPNPEPLFERDPWA